MERPEGTGFKSENYSTIAARRRAPMKIATVPGFGRGTSVGKASALATTQRKIIWLFFLGLRGA